MVSHTPLAEPAALEGYSGCTATAEIVCATVTAQAEDLASATLNMTCICCKHVKDTWTQARIWSSAWQITLLYLL